jgi:hypothetical protein
MRKRLHPEGKTGEDLADCMDGMVASELADTALLLATAVDMSDVGLRSG